MWFSTYTIFPQDTPALAYARILTTKRGRLFEVSQSRRKRQDASEDTLASIKNITQKITNLNKRTKKAASTTYTKSKLTDHKISAKF